MRLRLRKPRSAAEESEPATGGLESRLVWIFGSPRTGSTWLLEMLVHPWRLSLKEAGVRPPEDGPASPPDVLAVNETRLLSHLTPLAVASDDITLNQQRGGHSAYFFNDAFAHVWRPRITELVLARLGAQAEVASQRFGAHDPLVVVKEPNGSHGAPLVLSLLPASRLVFLVRDGRDVVDSLLARRLPGGHGPRQVAAAPVSGAQERLAYVRAASRGWVANVTSVQSAYEVHNPDLRHRVTYEEPRTDTLDSLGALTRWLRLDREAADLRATVETCAFEAIPAGKRGFGNTRRSARPGQWQENLTPLEQRAAHEIMGPKLEELGYSV